MSAATLTLSSVDTLSDATAVPSSTAISVGTSQLTTTATPEVVADTAMRLTDPAESEVAGIGAQVAPVFAATDDGLVADIIMGDKENATSTSPSTTNASTCSTHPSGIDAKAAVACFDVDAAASRIPASEVAVAVSAPEDVAVATSAAPITAPGVDMVALPVVAASTSRAEERSASGVSVAVSTSSVRLTAAIFAEARSKVSASVGPQERRDYLALAERIKSGRSGS